MILRATIRDTEATEDTEVRKGSSRESLWPPWSLWFDVATNEGKRREPDHFPGIANTLSSTGTFTSMFEIVSVASSWPLTRVRMVRGIIRPSTGW